MPGSGTEPDVLRKVTEKLAAALEVQGFLIAVLPEEKLQRTAVLHLLAAGNTVSDRWSVNFGESAAYLRFLAAVDQRAALQRPWSGLITVDTLLHDGVPVLRVVPGSPAALAGVARMDFKVYAKYSAIGGVIWGTGVTLAGYYLGQIDVIRENVELIAVMIVAASVVPIAIEIVRRRASSRKTSKTP